MRRDRAITLVISKAATVDEYLAELPDDRRAAIARFRSLAKKHLVGFREGMRWGMVNFHRAENEQVSFASQAQYIALYVGPGILDAHRAALARVDVGKGCLRFRSPETIDWGLVARLMIDSANREVAGRKGKQN